MKVKTLRKMGAVVKLRVNSGNRTMIFSAPQLDQVTSHISSVLWMQRFDSGGGESTRRTFVNHLLNTLIEVGNSALSKSFPDMMLSVRSEYAMTTSITDTHGKLSDVKGSIDLTVVNRKKSIQVVVEVKQFLPDCELQDDSTVMGQFVSELMGASQHNQALGSTSGIIRGIITDGRQFNFYLAKFDGTKFIVTRLNRSSYSLFEGFPCDSASITTHLTVEMLLVSLYGVSMKSDVDFRAALVASRAEKTRFIESFTGNAALLTIQADTAKSIMDALEKLEAAVSKQSKDIAFLKLKEAERCSAALKLRSKRKRLKAPQTRLVMKKAKKSPAPEAMGGRF